MITYIKIDHEEKDDEKQVTASFAAAEVMESVKMSIKSLIEHLTGKYSE
jgi:hypothetical protein